MELDEADSCSFKDHEGSTTGSSTMANFLKKPLYYWVKSFAEKEIHPGDSFKSFVGSNAVTYALEYIGIPTEEAEQSSLHLSAIFDEQDGPTSFNSSSTNSSSCCTNNRSISTVSSTNNSLNSSINHSHSYQQQQQHLQHHSHNFLHHNNTTKYSNQFESVEIKSRILQLNKIFNDLKIYFEDHFNQLVLIRPPNSVHISTTCQSCCLVEYEKILILLLGGAIQGLQRQDTIRKIKSYPPNIQEALIEAIKLAADNPELLHIKSWNEFTKLHQEEQQKIYETLLSTTRKLLVERNEYFQNQVLSDYIHGFINCERKRNSKSNLDWKCEILESEKASDELRTTTTMRQLRDELLEKSELLQECREELESTKAQLQSLQEELSDAQKQLKSFKKARDELDILREGQEKSQRLESELQRMKKKLEDSEQYYEKIEILQNENRNYQLKHAILMDQINMLTVDKERLEISFLTQSHYKTRDEENDENNSTPLKNRHKRNNGRNDDNEDLLIETEIYNQVKAKRTDNEEVQVQNEPLLLKNYISTPSAAANVSTSTTNLLQVEELTPIQPPTTIEQDGAFKDKEELVGQEENTGQLLLGELNPIKNQEVVEVPLDSPKVNKHPKKPLRKLSSLNTRRTRKALFQTKLSPSSTSKLHPKANFEDSVERIQENSAIDLQPTRDEVALSPDTKKIGLKPKRAQRRKQWSSIKEKGLVPNLEFEANDADEELSLSPNNNINEETNEIEIDEEFLLPVTNINTNELELIIPPENQNQNQVQDCLENYSAANISGLNPHHNLDNNNTDLLSNHSSIIVSDDDAGSTSDNEIFFICSSNATTSATNSNLRISNGRNVPIVQITTGSSTMRPSDSDNEPTNNSHRDQNSDRYTQDLLTNCNIQLSLHHVNSHDINIGNGGNVNNGLFEYPTPPSNLLNNGRISASTAYVNKVPKYSTTTTAPSTLPVNFNLGNCHSQCVPTADDDTSSTEDDDSVWYEYGCV